MTRALGVPRYGQPAFNDPPNAAARAAVPRMFGVADQDHSGSLSRAELTVAFTAWFAEWDTQKDGALSADEIRGGLDKAVPLPAPPPEMTDADYAKAERDAKASFRAGFRVEMPRAYDIGRHEVTQGQWKKVMGANPSVFPLDKSRPDADEYPVDSVTWEQAQDFVRRLNALENTTAYRLPTEFEWEYAARGGATDDIAWTKIREQAHMGLGRYKETGAVGRLQPNPWGLYDTLGNVWEWVQDFYNEKLFADPRPPRSGKVHVLKGSGFLGDVKNATYLTHDAGPANGFDVGFRIVRAAKQP
jgi:formylglycine-generating enzyme required for sulfatase activity